VPSNSCGVRKVNSPQISYRARDDATPEGEGNALANVFRFVLFERSAASKKKFVRLAPEPDGREDMKPSPTAGAPSREWEA
jgi:hypothetical protein